MTYEFKPFRYSSHEKIINLVPKGSKVLDIGCASGYLASQLNKKDCIVYGIDNDKEYLAQAKKHCVRVQLLDISKEKVDGEFDVIILGDIIEHTQNPEEILKKLKNNLNKGGTIIVSVPNILNIYARLRILLGTYPQDDKGVFDRTHLRPFTIKILNEMIKEQGFKRSNFHYTPIPLKLIFPNFPNLFSDLLQFTTYLWPNLFAYQLIAKIN